MNGLFIVYSFRVVLEGELKLYVTNPLSVLDEYG